MQKETLKAENVEAKTRVEVYQLVENARDAELRRDFEDLKRIFKPIWSNIEKNPEFDGFDHEVRADLMRLAGGFLSTYGRSKGIINFQERGRDLLTNAIEIFDDHNYFHKSNEAKILLAVTYFYEGRVDETDIILQEAAAYYENNQLHPVYLSICLNNIGICHWKRDFQKASEILEQIRIPMGLCEDPALLAQYHNQAGLIFARIGNRKKARANYEKALFYAQEIGNLQNAGLYLNNLAYANSYDGNYHEALQNADEAQDIFSQIKEDGWLAMVYDTKARVFLNQDEFSSALEESNKSISLFRKGEDFGALTDALWVKVHIRLLMNEKEKAFMDFAELTEIASKHIGRYAVQKYAKEFAKIVYVRKNQSFTEEVKEFKREMITESLLEANADMTQAAKLLKISRKKLTNTINKQFPEIYLELGVTPSLINN